MRVGIWKKAYVIKPKNRFWQSNFKLKMFKIYNVNRYKKLLSQFYFIFFLHTTNSSLFWQLILAVVPSSGQSLTDTNREILVNFILYILSYR